MHLSSPLCILYAGVGIEMPIKGFWQSRAFGSLILLHKVE